MEEIVELENVENVCRLCLSADEPKSSVFGIQDSPVSLAVKIQACLSIQITTADRLSTLICAQCVKTIDQWHSYKELCLRSQDKLHQWLEKHLQTSPMVVTIKDEPVDIDFYEDNIQIISETTNSTDLNVEDFSSTLNDKGPNDVEDPIAVDTDDTSVHKDLESPETLFIKDTGADGYQIDKELCTAPIKAETNEDYDTDCTIEIESVTGSELVLNPVAAKDDIIMEADSTQKSSAGASGNKKKMKRGPHTHFRGMRVFKQKCTHCQINLHSKYSYTNHMKRFHSQDDTAVTDISQSQNGEELIEDLEDELVSMEKDAPLTQVQQNIISQLKTFSCYSCEQTFSDRRSTLSHIRQHMPDLRPYTCVACLTEFPDRSMYKLHCGASFECAMKIALVIPKYGEEKYFTCNMCLRSMQNRKELLSHLSKHSDKQYEELRAPSRSPPKLKRMTPISSSKKDATRKPQPTNTAANISIPSPYKDGDPAHNHICDLCGMIYRYKPNMLKHRELCMRLSPDVRTSYKCVHCGMTFLVFSKFHNHIAMDHKKKDFLCSKCNTKCKTPSEYLVHHESHRTVSGNKLAQEKPDDAKTAQQVSPAKDWNLHEADVNSKGRVTQRYNCALCSLDFATRAELTEHRNLHLKVKIYSCVICRSMFSSAGALEIHMKDHGIEDPIERNANSSCVEYEKLDESMENKKPMDTTSTSEPDMYKNECDDCGKMFSNYANLRRHVRNVHTDDRSKFSCYECCRTFTSQKLCAQHMQAEHKLEKAMHQCPKCPKSFVFLANLNLHYESAHGEKSNDIQQCDICGKIFPELASLKIHKGWHNRVNSRLSTQFKPEMRNDKTKSLKTPKAGEPSEPSKSEERPARARKSFPNPPPAKPAAEPSDSRSEHFQCQVCEDKFSDVADLRNHLWDVHCARNKPEKHFTNDELQCELCTNVFPDQETLKLHMQWHKAHPILSDIPKKTFPCETCGKLYSSKKVLWRHKKLHKATNVAAFKFHSLSKKTMVNQYQCSICRKVFGRSQSLQRHKLTIHADVINRRTQPAVQNNVRRDSVVEPSTKKIKMEEIESFQKSPPTALTPNAIKKPVTCHLCKKPFPNMSVLYKHRQFAHKPRFPTTEVSDVSDRVFCGICFKDFSSLKNLKQHTTIKHKNPSQYSCPIDKCNTQSPVKGDTSDAGQGSMLFCCKLCDRHVFSREAITGHVQTVHKTIYDAEADKNFHRETDLSTYVVRGAVGIVCPRCKIKYPNNKAMKIHYFKFHEGGDTKTDLNKRRTIV